VLLYGSENWTIKVRDSRRISAPQMKYTIRAAGYTWIDYKTNTQIAKETQDLQAPGQRAILKKPFYLPVT
jgi:hypothetical protein